MKFWLSSIIALRLIFRLTLSKTLVKKIYTYSSIQTEIFAEIKSFKKFFNQAKLFDHQIYRFWSLHNLNAFEKFLRYARKI